MTRLLAAPLLVLVVALAGCNAPAPPPGGITATPTTGAGMGECSVALDELPGHALVGTHSIVVMPECDFDWSSQHVAAHYANTSTDTPTLQHYATACTPVSADHEDAEILVDCEFTATGTFYLRGHTIIVNDGEPTHYWTREYVVQVVDEEDPVLGGVDVSIWNVPSTARVGEEIPLHLVVSWAVGTTASSDHLGAHYANTSNPTGSTTHYAAACAHVAGDVPGEFDFTCTFNDEGTMYLRGHARFENGGQLQNYWSMETQIQVRP